MTHRRGEEEPACRILYPRAAVDPLELVLGRRKQNLCLCPATGRQRQLDHILFEKRVLRIK